MKIVACLGNPERKYAKTRHNIGFIIGAGLSQSAGIAVNKKSFSSVCGMGRVDGADCLVMFPQTYMNNSGTAVMQALNYYREDPDNLIIIHDEIELPFGEYSLKYGGGHRGHNGLRSINDKIGTLDFYRFRFGVGRPRNPDITVADHVLSKFTSEELDRIDLMLPEMIDVILSVIKKERVIN